MTPEPLSVKTQGGWGEVGWGGWGPTPLGSPAQARTHPHGLWRMVYHTYPLYPQSLSSSKYHLSHSVFSLVPITNISLSSHTSIKSSSTSSATLAITFTDLNLQTRSKTP